MVVPVGPFEYQVEAGQSADADTFDEHGYAFGRGVLAPEPLRACREPLIAALRDDGCVEPVAGEPDLFRWTGDLDSFDRLKYRTSMHAFGDLVRSGVLSAAIEAVWGRPAAIWGDASGIIAWPPGMPTRIHRDGWHKMGVGGPKDHCNLWLPLTDIGPADGALAVAEGSHLIVDPPAEVPIAHPFHLDASQNAGTHPVASEMEPLWRSSDFRVGDALVFRPDIAHSTTPNTGPYLRLAIRILAQDGRLPLAMSAGHSPDRTRSLTDVEWLTLALLAVQPTSRWLARCAFYPRGVVGRLWAEQPMQLVEDAFLILGERGLVEHYPTGDFPAAADGPTDIHHFYAATAVGCEQVSAWLTARTDGPLLALKLLLAGWLELEVSGLLDDAPSAALALDPLADRR